MYTRLLRKSSHTKTFTIRRHSSSGWHVLEQEDSRVILAVWYRDWHRVERAAQTFAGKAKSLVERGWTEHASAS